ncbi:MAG: class I adenylate-forming enzyme family protein [Gammaproteobacteria bacterium]
MSGLYRPLRISDGLHAVGRREPGRPALRCDGREFTYGELHDRVQRLAGAALRDLGVKLGDRVAILAPNCAEYPEVLCGFSDAGAIVVTLNPRSPAAELAAACRDCTPSVMVVHPSLEAVAREAIKLALDGRISRLIVLGPGYERWLAGSEPVTEAELPAFAETQPFTLVYSSGTTGQPKGIVISHRSRALTFHGMAMEYGCYGPDDRFLALAPMSHGAGFAFAMCTLYFGGFVEIASRFDPAQVLERLADGGFTGVFMVPTHFQAVFALPSEALAQRKGTAPLLRTIISNAAALPQSMKERIVAFFGEGLLHETYGSTEAGIVTNIRPQDQLRTKQSVGRAFALNEIRLLGADGDEVPVGEVGELFSRSPYLFEGYWNHPEWTAECSRNGWVSAGDLARRDAEGLLYIVDRKKDMVVTGGFNVYPREVEIVLEQHPAVREACVVGVPDEHWGERVRGFVVLREGREAGQALAEDIAELCRSRLAGYKSPRDIGFIAAVPRNIGGKVLKRELRDGHHECFSVHSREPRVQRTA